MRQANFTTSFFLSSAACLYWCANCVCVLCVWVVVKKIVVNVRDGFLLLSMCENKIVLVACSLSTVHAHTIDMNNVNRCICAKQHQKQQQQKIQSMIEFVCASNAPSKWRWDGDKWAHSSLWPCRTYRRRVLLSIARSSAMLVRIRAWAIKYAVFVHHNFLEFERQIKLQSCSGAGRSTRIWLQFPRSPRPMYRTQSNVNWLHCQRPIKVIKCSWHIGAVVSVSLDEEHQAAGMALSSLSPIDSIASIAYSASLDYNRIWLACENTSHMSIDSRNSPNNIYAHLTAEEATKFHCRKG